MHGRGLLLLVCFLLWSEGEANKAGTTLQVGDFTREMYERQHRHAVTPRSSSSSNSDEDSPQQQLEQQLPRGFPTHSSLLRRKGKGEVSSMAEDSSGSKLPSLMQLSLGRAQGPLRPVSPSGPSNPAIPADPANPTKPFLIENLIGHHFPMMGKAFEAMFDRHEKRLMEGQYVPYAFDPEGNQDGHGQGYDDPLGQLPSETNLCFALLENWLRSCSEPQVMLELEATTTTSTSTASSTESSSKSKSKSKSKSLTETIILGPEPSIALNSAFQDNTNNYNNNNLNNDLNNNMNSKLITTNEAPVDMTGLTINKLSGNGELDWLPTSPQDLKTWAQTESFVNMRNGLFEAANGSLLMAVFKNQTYLKTLMECAEHPSLIAPTIASPVGHEILQIIHQFISSKPQLQSLASQGALQMSGASRPMAPFIGTLIFIMTALVTIVSTMMSVLLGIANGMDSANSSLSGVLGSNPSLDSLWGMMRADKGSSGIRAGFVQPEVYDARGPYGPEPFPFQTPGAEKCHRYLVSYVHKCAVN